MVNQIDVGKKQLFHGLLLKNPFSANNEVTRKEMSCLHPNQPTNQQTILSMTHFYRARSINDVRVLFNQRPIILF